MTLTVAAIGLLTTSACAIDVRGDDSVVREEKRFTVSGQPELRLRTFDGSIRLRSWDRNEVLVEIEKRGPDQETAKALTVDMAQQGNRIVVEVPEPRAKREIHIGSWQSPSVSLNITAPRRMIVDAHTGDGSIAADDIAGTIAMTTGDGSIAIKRIDGTVKIHTGDGSIRVSNALGTLQAESGDGSIDVDGRFEGLDVRSGDGSVQVSADNGSVVKSDWSITTGDGSIAVRLPSNIDADLDAHSSDGRVQADGFSGLTTDNRRDADSSSVRGKLGKGGRSLKVRSGDGSISIRGR